MEILLVEDTKADAILVQQALKQLEIEYVLHVAENGQVALDMLKGVNGKPGILKPDLILLDLYMPKIEGFEVLEQIREDDSFKDTPIIILTSSTEEYDISDSLRLYANAFIVKPINKDKLQATIKLIQNKADK